LLTLNRLATQAYISLRAAVVTDEAAFNVLRLEWDRLLAESDQRVYFLRWSWNQLWWQVFKPQASRLFVITCRDEQGRLAGLAPLFLRQRRTAGIPHVREVMFLGTGIYAQTSEYLDVVARRGYERAVAETVGKYLRESKEWDRLWLKEVPSGSVVLPHLVETLGSGAEVEACNRSHYIDTTSDWEIFRQSLSRSTRKHLARQTRRFFETYDCQFKRVDREEEIGQAMDALVRLHQARWRSKGEPGSFALPGIEELLRGAAQEGMREGRLRLWTLALNGEIAAVRLAFFDNGVVHAIQGGFDPAYTKDSLGSVMLGLCIRDCIEDETVREYDFMGGTDAYKDWWTKDGRETVTLTCMRSGVRSFTYSSLGRAKGVGKSLLRATVPQPIRRTAHRIIDRRHYSRCV
jgi:CelD/BcsL family acetyltransferase involved in cellulose biosynthesis